MSSLAVIDIVFLVLVCLLVLRGGIRGFIREFLSWPTLALGILGAVFFYKNGALFIERQFLPGMKVLPEILAFAGIFVIIFLAFKILEKILRDIVEGIHLGGVDKALGAVFGFLEGAALTAFVLFALAIQPLFDPSAVLGSSVFANILLPLIFNFPMGGGMVSRV
jgi:membrane protein required for colicin V production